jgi:hypothetical protein
MFKMQLRYCIWFEITEGETAELPVMTLFAVLLTIYHMDVGIST